MSWRIEKTDAGNDLVWDGVEKGIGQSPTTGTANIQNANISTETGEVLASYGRVAQQQAAITGGTLTPSGTTLLNAPANLKAGDWITLTASTISSLPDNTSPVTSVAIDYLIVAGGGAGGSAFGNPAAGGGGGAGAAIASSSTVAVGSYAVSVGAGGTVVGLAQGGPGGNSSIATIATATGGGGGGEGQVANVNGNNGGSGGGGGALSGTGAGTAGTGTTGGNNAGAGYQDGTRAAGGGGGGAGGTGTAGSNISTNGTGGTGGIPLVSSITGTSTSYAGGGGGGGGTQGGPGGGGFGSPSGAGDGGSGINVGGNAVANTGSGGGGASSNASTVKQGGNGGSGIVVISYTTGTMFATGGGVSFSGGKTIHTFLADDVFVVHNIVSPGTYYVSYKNGSNQIKLSAHYDPYAQHAIVHGTTGSATFNTVTVPAAGIAKATEKYGTATSTEYRYYIMDSNGYVWVYDTAVYTASLAASGVGTTWMLPDYTDYSSLNFSGFTVLNGWAMAVSHTFLYGKPTSDLGRFFSQLQNSKLNNPFPTHNNFAYVGHQGKMYYCDGNYIGQLFPTTSFETNIANIQSFSSYTASGTTGTFTSVIGGSLPYDPGGSRIPAVFFTDQYGTTPTALVEGVVYYIEVKPNLGTFQVFASITGNTAIDISTGATGNQYFNTFYPLGPHSGINGDHSLVTFSAQRVNLPYNEIATSLIEIGNTVIIGGVTNILYPWNQIDATPSDFIALPEAGVVAMENVNNTAYILAGNKGNIYISNGSVASAALSIPDYCAGVPGTPITYIEPYFTWGDISYIRGRVYVSILDQTATKAGNTGGVWSFIPSQNYYIGQDVGTALRLENQNSYGSYNGFARLIIPNQQQQAISPQYWTSWQNSYTIGTSTFGIDYTDTVPVTQYIVETDLLPTGSFLAKQSFQQLEYKLTAAMAAGDGVEIYYRLNSTDAWSDSMVIVEETDNRLSGYAEVNFQKTQWVQFRIVVTTNGTTSSSFVRLKQLMLR